MPALLRWLLRLGPTNPIAVRLVQGGSTRLRHLYIRSGYLAALIVVLLWSLLIHSNAGALSYRELAAAGATSFKYVAYLQVGLICLLAPLFMAGAIAQEANPRTWDILLTTPLSAAQIVLGNLAGRLFFILALLVASLPLFAVTQYFGGVPGRSILLSYVIAAVSALVVGTIAITLSVSRIAGRRAVFVFYIAVVTYLALTLAIDSAIRAGGLTTVMTPLNPFLALQTLLDPAGYAPHDPIALQGRSWLARAWFGAPVASFVGLAAGVSLVLTVLSVFSVRSATLQGLRLQRRGEGQRVSAGRPPKAVWRNPIAWREAQSRGGVTRQLARWAFLGLGLLWAVGLIAYFHGGALGVGDFRFALLATVWTELAVIVLVAINSASTTIAREREDGTLDLLLTTPVTPGAYLGGKLRGLISFLGPMLAVPIATAVLAAAYVALDGLGREGGVLYSAAVGTGTVDLPAILPVAALAAPLTIVPFVALCAMVGLQWSLKSKSSIASAVATFAVVGVVAGVLGLCGWRGGADIAYFGPVLASLNPATALYAAIEPARGGAETLIAADGRTSGLTSALAIGSLIAAAGYTVVVLAMKASMVRSFDMTVRRLAGTR